MEVMVEVSSIPAYVSGTAQDKRREEEEEEEEEVVEEGRGGVVVVSRFAGQSGGGGFLSGSGKRSVGSEEPEASSETSSLGNPSDDEEDDVVSSGGGGDKDNDVSAGAVFGSLSSLEDSLPIKRGLSNCFSGRSKSFANLSSVKTLQDLQKEENPFNKRRKTLIAYKLSRKNSGFYSWQNPNSMPLLALKEETNQENNSSEDEEQKKLHGRKIKAFKSTSFFSLTDL